MMDLFEKRASTGDKVVLTLKNGKEMEGEITDFGMDYIALKTKRGIAGVHHSMVGTWEVLLDSDKVQSKKENEISYLELEPGTAPDETDIEYVQIEDTEIPEDEEKEENNEDKSLFEDRIEDNNFFEARIEDKSFFEDQIEDYSLIEARIEEILRDFTAKVAGSELALHEHDPSLPLNILDSDNLQEEKKQWDKINSQYQNCIKNRNYSQLSILASELLKFAEKHPEIGVFHYNAGCFLTRIEAFEKALAHFEEAFAREPSPGYLYNAAYAALEIPDFEKAHINLATYFNMVRPTDDPGAWYTFCGLTEKEPLISVFRNVLFSSLEGRSVEEGNEGKEIDQLNEDYDRNSPLLLLKSTLYVLQKNRKYREAEPLITFLEELKNGKEVIDWEKVESLLDLALAGFSENKPAEYRNRIEISNEYEKDTNFNIALNGEGEEEEETEAEAETEAKVGAETGKGAETKARAETGKETETKARVETGKGAETKARAETGKGTETKKRAETGKETETKKRAETKTEAEEGEMDVEELNSFSFKSSSFYGDECCDKSGSSEAFYSTVPRRHGYIFKYIAPQGYGFIRDEEGRTPFFHLSSVIDGSISAMELSNVYWGAEVHVIFQPAVGEHGNIAVRISAYEVLDEMQKLAERYAEGGDYKKAIELSEYLLSIDSNYPISETHLESWKGKQKEILEKEEELNERVEKEPKSREGWNSKASFLIEHKRYEEALPALERVIELTPEIVNSLPVRRQISSFSAIYDSNPEYARALRKKGFVLHKLGRDKEALETINEALDLEPEHAGALALRSSGLLKLDRPQEAQEIIDFLLEKEPENPEFLFLKGKALLKFYEYEAGIEYLEKALEKAPKKSPEKPEILLKYGYALSKLGSFDEAIKAYDKVLSIQPENNLALSNKGFILIMTGEYEKALDLYNGLIQLNPLNARLWSKKGAILTKMNRSEEASRAVDRALEIAPKNAETLFTKGYIYSKIGRDEEALRYFDRVLALTPFDQKALAKRAFVLSKLGRHAEAFESIGEALDISRYNPRTWYYKGVIHYNLEEYDEALFAFNKSAELNPADDRIERMKQFTLVKLGRYEGEMEATTSELLVEEELFDKELQEEYDSAFEN